MYASSMMPCRLTPILFSVLCIPMYALGSTCEDPDVQSISVPVYPDRPESERFDYSYRWKKTKESDPLVIVVGGGPGQNTIAAESPPILGAFPEHFNVIYTDPRGSGCNDTHDFLDDAITTKHLAYDVLFLVRHLEELRGKPFEYYVYGASYGTQHATVLAALIESERATAPNAVILEGIVGHHFEDFEDYFGNIQSEWERVKNEDLDLDVRGFFESELPAVSSPEGVSSKVWGQFVSLQVILGFLPKAEKQYEHLLNWYVKNPKARDSLISQLGAVSYSSADGTDLQMGRVFTLIGCREIWGEMHSGRDLVDGRLVSFGPDICADIPFSDPYDSASWRISSPIFYFQGIHDPTTTLAQANYHFDHQTSPRRMAVVERASHAPLSLGLRPCAAKIWDSITGDQAKFEEVVGECAAEVGTEVSVRTNDWFVDVDSTVSRLPPARRSRKLVSRAARLGSL